MGADDDDRRRDYGTSWTSWFKPTDSRRLEEARSNSKATLDETEQQFTHWIEQQDAETQVKRHADVVEELAREREREVNPFVAFKSFVDDGFAAIAHFPSHFRERTGRKEQTAVKETEDKWRHWSGRNDTVDYVESCRKDFAAAAWPSLPKEDQDRAREATTMLLNQAMSRNAHVPTHKLALLFHDPEARSLSIPPAVTQPWLSVAWFRHSQYSPVNLERHPHLGQFDTKWRNAFEDLLEAALDKPMSSQEKYGVRPPYFHPTQTWRGSGLDWMLSLQCRGILPPQLPSRYLRLDLADPGFGVPDTVSAHIARTIEAPDRYMREQDTQSLLEQVAIPPDTKSEELSEAQTTELDVYEQQAARTGMCPDDVGAAIQEAVQQERDASASSERSTGQCPDDLGRAILLQEIANLTWQPTMSDQQLQDYRSGLYLEEHQNRKRVSRQREEPNQREALQPGQCPDELGRQVQVASSDEESRCPDEIGHAIGADARRLGCSVDELLEKLDEDEFYDDDGRLPGELWSLNQQIKAREEAERYEAQKETWRKWIRQDESIDRPAHEIMARHWDRVENLSQHYDTRTMSPETGEKEEKPVSTSMTTLTTRLADGQVTTKIVRKVRYADGREENSESVHTSQGEQVENQAGEENQAKKGWFWS